MGRLRGLIEQDPRFDDTYYRKFSRKKFQLSSKNIKQRLLYCNYHLKKKTLFHNWAISDECTFKMTEIDPKFGWIEENINKIIKTNMIILIN